MSGTPEGITAGLKRQASVLGVGQMVSECGIIIVYGYWIPCCCLYCSTIQMKTKCGVIIVQDRQCIESYQVVYISLEPAGSAVCGVVIALTSIRVESTLTTVVVVVQ